MRRALISSLVVLIACGPGPEVMGDGGGSGNAGGGAGGSAGGTAGGSSGGEAGGIEITDTGIKDFGQTFPNRIHAFLEDITKGVPFEATLGVTTALPRRLEAVFEEAGNQRVGIGQRGDALTEIARRQQAQLAPQPSGRAAVIADGDHGGEIAGVLL